MVCSAVLLPTIPLQAQLKTSLAVGLDYSTGQYGATSSTEIWYLPFVLKVETSKLVYKFTLPYLQITGPGNVIGVDAAPGSGGSAITTETGLGDIVTAVSYSVLPYQAKRVLLDITGKIKFPTADKTRALGTGENDYSIQADGFYTVSRLSTFGSIGYKLYGDPPGVDYRNVLFYSIGGVYSLSDTTGIGVVYDYRQATTQNGTDPQEVTFFTSKKLLKNKKMLAYLVKGFSQGSPEWGIGIKMSYVLTGG